MEVYGQLIIKQENGNQNGKKDNKKGEIKMVKNKNNSDIYQMMQMEMSEKNNCSDRGKYYVEGYVKRDGTWVKGYCRERTSSELPRFGYEQYGAEPYIRFGGRRSNYIKTEMSDPEGHYNGRWNSKDGYHVIHNGKYHHVYKEE